jgi:hypothetical protein
VGKKEANENETLVLPCGGMEVSAEPASAAIEEALIERMLMIRDRRGQLVPLRANPAQQMYEQRKGRQNIVLKARQMGITTWVASRFFLRTITHPGTLTLQVAHTRSAAEGIFRTVHRMWEQLPEDLRKGRLARSRSNLGQMIFRELDSEFRVASACDVGVGRGVSVHNLHCSEVSRWPGDAAETLAGLRAALHPEGELVLESTPNGAYGAFYKEWREGTDEAGSDSGLVRHFLPWWLEPAYTGTRVEPEAMTEEEQALVIRHDLSPERIGFRRGLQKSYGVLRSQEFAEDAESCFRATGSCYFDIGAIERRLLDVENPREIRDGGALQVFMPPLPGSEYLVGVDSAGGGSDGDFAAVQVIEMSTGIQCAELQKRLRPAELARAAAALGREYGGCVGGAMIAVERNNHGGSVIAYLESQERYKRLWRDGDETGWLTSGTSKPEMVSRVGFMLDDRPESFLSRRLLGELRTFVAGEHGKCGAANGAHDDLVMAMAVAQTVRLRMLGRNGKGMLH